MALGVLFLGKDRCHISFWLSLSILTTANAQTLGQGGLSACTETCPFIIGVSNSNITYFDETSAVVDIDDLQQRPLLNESSIRVMCLPGFNSSHGRAYTSTCTGVALENSSSLLNWSPFLVPCIDIDECLSTPCHGNTICLNHPGSYSCRCAAGFERNGINRCEPVNRDSIDNTSCISIDNSDNDTDRYLIYGLAASGGVHLLTFLIIIYLLLQKRRNSGKIRTMSQEILTKTRTLSSLSDKNNGPSSTTSTLCVYDDDFKSEPPKTFGRTGSKSEFFRNRTSTFREVQSPGVTSEKRFSQFHEGDTFVVNPDQGEEKNDASFGYLLGNGDNGVVAFANPGSSLPLHTMPETSSFMD